MVTFCHKPSLDRYQANSLMAAFCHKPSLDRYQANSLMAALCHKPSLDRYQANSLMETFCHKPSLDRYQANSLMAIFCHKPNLDKYQANSIFFRIRKTQCDLDLKLCERHSCSWSCTTTRRLFVKTLAVWKILSRPNFDTRIQKHADKQNN